VCRDSLALLYVGGAPCAATPLPLRALRSCSPSFPRSSLSSSCPSCLRGESPLPFRASRSCFPSFPPRPSLPRAPPRRRRGKRVSRPALRDRGGSPLPPPSRLLRTSRELSFPVRRSPRPGGGIGRRSGLKIRFPKGSTGSSPVLGTRSPSLLTPANANSGYILATDFQG
jgi:hypothetical protein